MGRGARPQLAKDEGRLCSVCCRTRRVRFARARSTNWARTARTRDRDNASLPLRVKVCKKITAPRDTIASATTQRAASKYRLYALAKPVGLSFSASLGALRTPVPEVIAAPARDQWERRADERGEPLVDRQPAPRARSTPLARVRRPEPCERSRPRSCESGAERGPAVRPSGTQARVASHHQNIFGDGTRVNLNTKSS